MRRNSRSLSLVCSLLLCTFLAHAQPVYKWVDAQGKTHYGQQPTTTDKSPEAVKLHGNSGFGGDNNGKALSAEYNADGTKKIPKDVQEFASGMEKALKKADPKTVPLDCAAAVSNAHEQGETALEVSAKNLKSSYITQADFDSNAANIRRAMATTTVGHCQGASGKDLAFYQCMSNGNNHFLACINR